MRIPAAILALAAAGCASVPVTLGKPPPADSEEARRQEADAASLFARAEALRDEGDLEGARSLFGDVREDYPGSPLAGEAQFQEAECAFGAGRIFAAGELFGKYVEDRPLSPRVEVVEKRLFEIGNRLIDEGKAGFLGLGVFTTSEEGVSVLRKLATLLPTGTLADDALMRLGRYYAENRDFVGAESTLDELLKNYPASEWRLQARFLLAWTFREDNRGPAYDGEKLRRARAHFLAYIEQATVDADRAAEYAGPVKAARDEVAAIDEDLARKAALRARFYRRSGHPRAALFVYRVAARRWPDTVAGKECARLAEDLSGEMGFPPEEPPPPAPAPKAEAP